MGRAITGKVEIRIDGELIGTENQATLNPGGVNRSPESHGGRTYYTEEDVPPELECTVQLTKEVDVIFLSNIVGATVLFEANTGQQFIMRQAFTTEPVVHAGNGKAPMKMSADSVDKV